MLIELTSAVEKENLRPCRTRVAQAIEARDGRYTGRNDHQTFIEYKKPRRGGDKEDHNIISQFLTLGVIIHLGRRFLKPLRRYPELLRCTILYLLIALYYNWGKPKKPVFETCFPQIL